MWLPQPVERVDKSAGRLGVDHLDLLLLHQPLPSRFNLTRDAFRALEKLPADCKVPAASSLAVPSSWKAV